MVKHRLYLAALFLFFASNKTYAQNNPVSLKEAWDHASENYPALTGKKILISEAEYRKSAVKNAALPKVQAQFQNTFGSYSGSAGAFFPLPGIFNVNGAKSTAEQPAATANVYGSVLVDWKLFEFGRHTKEVAAAGYAVKEAESELNTAKLQLQSKVARLYLNILYNQAKTEWAKQTAGRVKEILGVSTSLTAAGLRPGADTLLAASSYLQTLAELDDWSGKLAASRIQFKEVVPSGPENVMLKDHSFLVPLSQDFEADSFDVRHPYLEGIRQRILSDRSRQQVADRKKFPSLSLLGGLSSRSSGIAENGKVSSSWSSGFENSTGNYLVGLGLSWNISDVYNSLTESKIIGRQLAATQSRYDLQALQLHTGIESASSRINMQLKQVINTSRAVQNAGSAYELYLSRYENGLISLTELLQIQLLLQQSEKVNIEAFQQLWDQMILRSELTGDFSVLSNHF